MFLSTVPSAPQNLTADYISDEEVHLFWAPPLTSTVVVIPNTLHQAADNDPTDAHADDPSKNVGVLAPESIKNKYLYHSDQLKYDNEYSTSNILMGYRSAREARLYKHRKRRHENATETKTHEHYDFVPSQIELEGKNYKNIQKRQYKDTSEIAYVLFYEEGTPITSGYEINGVQRPDDVRVKNTFASDFGMEINNVKNLTLHNTSGKVTKVVGFWLKNLSKYSN